MSMLNFKYGSFAKLPADISNGTIYVTTDEKAMYVDLDSKRIRLSQIISLSTSDWQKLTPPYSIEAFYYLTDSNALLKYNGSDWVQINSLTEITSALKGLGFLGVVASLPTTNLKKGQICTYNDANYIYTGSEWKAVGLVGAEILDLQSTVSSLSDTVSSHTGSLNTLNSFKGDIAKAVGYAGSGTTLPSSASEGDIFVHNGTVKVYGYATKDATTMSWNVATNASARIVALSKRIEEVSAAAGDKSDVLELQTNLQTLTNAVNNSTTGLAATKKIADDVTSAFNKYKSDHANDYTNAQIDSAVADAKKAGTDAAAAVNNLKNTEVKANADAISKIKDGTEIDSFADVEAKISDVNAKFSDYATKKNLADEKTNILGEEGYQGTVKGAYEAAAAASGAAGDAATAANTQKGRIDAILSGASSGYTTFKGVEDKIKSINQTITNLDDTYATDSELAAAKTAVLGEANYSGTVKGAYGAADAAQQSATTANNAITALKKDATITTFKGIEDKIAGLKTSDIGGMDNYATDTELSNAVAAARGQTTETVASVDAKVGTNATNIAKNTQDISDLSSRLTSSLQTADAMIYKGSISTATGTTGLPTAGVGIGWTYKVTADILKSELNKSGAPTVNFGTPASETNIRIGDLLVATGTESSGVITAATLKWDHIPSGYHADYVPTMTATSLTNGAEIKLTSAHAASNAQGDLGKFQISAASGSAVTVAQTTGNNIAIGMSWGQF